MARNLTVRYEYLKGKHGEMFPYAVFVEDGTNEVLFSSSIYVPCEKCEIPKELQEVCSSSPSECLVKVRIDNFVKSMAFAQ